MISHSPNRPNLLELAKNAYRRSARALPKSIGKSGDAPKSPVRVRIEEAGQEPSAVKEAGRPRCKCMTWFRP